MDNSFSSCRGEAFPAGLRVLVVDDDPTWLKILEKMLKKCSYEVTTCCLAKVALDLLRERRDRFDIVISDVNMPDMDGFKLLEHVGLEMDLPVIMMSVDGETSRVMKGVQHGACDYLLKPVRMKELKNIWQHVFRKKMHEMKEFENHEAIDSFQFMTQKLDEFEDMNILYAADFNSNKKRKDIDNRERGDQDFIHSPSMKKARVVWSVDLHQKFVNAVNHIGFDKVGPKKILDLMNVPGLTRENVASHLQKYRLYLSRIQKQNDEFATGTTHSDVISKETVERIVTFQTSAALSLKSSISSNSTHSYSCKEIQPKSPTRDFSEDKFKEAMEQPENSSKPVPGSISASQEAKDDSCLDAIQPQGIVQNGDYNHSQHSLLSSHPWTDGFSLMHYLQRQRQPKACFNMLSEYQHAAQCGRTCEDDYLLVLSSTGSTNINCQKSSLGHAQIKPSEIDSSRNYIRNMTTTNYGVNLFNQFQHEDTSFEHLGLGLNGYPSPIGQSTDQNSTDVLESPERFDIKDESVTYTSSHEDLLCLLPGYSYFEDVKLKSMNLHEYSTLNSTTELRENMYDELQFDSEYFFDMMGFPTIEGGLFA